MKPQPPSIRSANGTASMQPRATPWECGTPRCQGLKARSNRRGFGAGFQPLCLTGPLSQGVALGWDKAGALPLRIAANAAFEAESPQGLGKIRALI